MKLKHLTILLVPLTLLSLSACSNRQEAPGQDTNTEPKIYKQENSEDSKVVKGIDLQISEKMGAAIPAPFKYKNGHKIWQMRPLDNLGRATGTHIQLKESQTPNKARSTYLTVKPSGWHNYKFTTKDHGKIRYTWLYNRGHLVGYQFCGLNNEPKNLITETTYLNQGSLTGMKPSNKSAMLFYENGLRKWLIKHPKNSLDYSVTPAYSNNELVARYVVLTYTGYTDKGRPIKINLHSPKQKNFGKITCVLLKNASPQVKINYQTGSAKVHDIN